MSPSTMSTRPTLWIVRSDSSSMETARGSLTVLSFRSRSRVSTRSTPRMFSSTNPLDHALGFADGALDRAHVRDAHMAGDAAVGLDVVLEPRHRRLAVDAVHCVG